MLHYNNDNANHILKKSLDNEVFQCYIITMTTQTTFEPCSQCGNDALLLEENNGTCLSCLFPASPREPVEGSFIEGCGCELCKETA